MRKVSLLAVAIVACFLTIATTASAASDRYASVTGGGDCFTAATACSLTDALAAANDDETVHVLPGTYELPSTLNLNKSIYVDGETATNTIFHATSTDMYGVYLANDLTFSDITIDVDGAEYGIGSQFGSTPILLRSIVKSATGHACHGYSLTIVDSICLSTKSDGFGFWNNTSGESPKLTLRNSTIVGGSSGYGLYIGMNRSTYDVNVTNTIIEGGFASLGVHAAGPESEPGILNFNITHSNFFVYETGESDYGQLNETLEDPSNQWGVEPLLAANYTQLAGSPTIDAGTTVGLTSSTDLAGLVRNQGSAPDIGAYEFPVAAVIDPPATGGGTTPPPALDTIKPKLTISKKPKSKTTSKKLSVSFKADETATYLCKLDKGKFKSCKSPYKKTVKLGKHKLQIKATDAAGNVSSVKTISWTVKKS